MRMSAFNLMKRCLALAIGAMVVLAIQGCASDQHTDAKAASGAFSGDLTLFSRDGTDAEEYFKVSQDGTIGFGGGMNARLEKISWTGPMTPEELKSLGELIASHDWCKRDWVSTRVPEKALYRISLQTDECHRTIRLKGEHPDVNPVRDLLRKAALRRLQPDLDRLPQPSIKK